jgi:VanZ family protein
MCYGAVDEMHQLLVAQRIADLGDLAADGLGALLALWGWVQAERHWPWLR